MLFLAVLALKGIDITQIILFSLLFTFLKLEITLALVFFFSTFMSHILTILVSIMIYFMSHSMSLLLDLVLRVKNTFLFTFVQGIQILFPPFEALNTKDVIGTFEIFTYQYYIFNTIYAFVYLALILFLAVLIFNKKSFER